jgi:hypothetical protein
MQAATPTAAGAGPIGLGETSDGEHFDELSGGEEPDGAPGHSRHTDLLATLSGR